MSSKWKEVISTKKLSLKNINGTSCHPPSNDDGIEEESVGRVRVD